MRALYETKVFGTLAVIQAVLPLLLAQGHFVGVSSGLELVLLPIIDTYGSIKRAFEALHEKLLDTVTGRGTRAGNNYPLNLSP